MHLLFVCKLHTSVPFTNQCMHSQVSFTLFIMNFVHRIGRQKKIEWDTLFFACNKDIYCFCKTKWQNIMFTAATPHPTSVEISLTLHPKPVCVYRRVEIMHISFYTGVLYFVALSMIYVCMKSDVHNQEWIISSNQGTCSSSGVYFVVSIFFIKKSDIFGYVFILQLYDKKCSIAV